MEGYSEEIVLFLKRWNQNIHGASQGKIQRHNVRIE